MNIFLLVVVVIGVAGCALFLIRQMNDRKVDPYVTLSDRRVRLEKLKK